MLRSTIHLPPIEEGEFLLCYVKIKHLIKSKHNFSSLDFFIRINRMGCHLLIAKSDAWSMTIIRTFVTWIFFLRSMRISSANIS